MFHVEHSIFNPFGGEIRKDVSDEFSKFESKKNEIGIFT